MTDDQSAPAAPGLDQLITDLLEREGGFVDRKADAGGPTKFGVTQRKLSAWRNRPATIEEVQNLTAGEARLIYERDFAEMGLDVAPPEVRGLLLDLMENHGPNNGVRILQRALGVAVDGVFGRQTRAALAAAAGRVLFRELGAARLEFTGRVITKNLKDDDHNGVPDNTEFASGWLNRQAEFWRATP